MIFSVTSACLSSTSRENLWPPLPFQEELCELHVRRCRDLYISRRSHNDRHCVSGALDKRSFVRSHKAVSRCLVEGLLQNIVAEALRSLRQDHALSRESSSDQGAVGCPLDLLHRI